MQDVKDNIRKGATKKVNLFTQPQILFVSIVCGMTV